MQGTSRGAQIHGGKQMKYYIGQVAKLTDLSAAGLRLYEREGVLEASREDSSGYRYYERLDITALLRARTYQKYGFQLRKAGMLLNTSDMDYLCESYSELCRTLKQEILYKQKLLEHLQRTEYLVRSLPEQLGKIETAVRPAMYRLDFMHGNQFILKESQYPVFREWFSHAPFTFPSQCNSWSSLLNGEEETSFAIALFGEDVKSLGLQPLVETASYYPPCHCLHTVIRTDETMPSCIQTLKPLLDYVLTNEIPVVGDPVSEVIVSLNKKTNYTRYRQIWLPIQK